jgi:hypothetical protein
VVILDGSKDFHSEDRLPWHPEEAQRTITGLLAHETFEIFWLIEMDRQVAPL